MPARHFFSRCHQNPQETIRKATMQSTIAPLAAILRPLMKYFAFFRLSADGQKVIELFAESGRCEFGCHLNVQHLECFQDDKIL